MISGTVNIRMTGSGLPFVIFNCIEEILPVTNNCCWKIVIGRILFVKMFSYKILWYPLLSSYRGINRQFRVIRKNASARHCFCSCMAARHIDFQKYVHPCKHDSHISRYILMPGLLRAVHSRNPSAIRILRSIRSAVILISGRVVKSYNHLCASTTCFLTFDPGIRFYIHFT